MVDCYYGLLMACYDSLGCRWGLWLPGDPDVPCLGPFQVGSYRFLEPYRRSIYLIEALWKPSVP